MNQSFLNVYSQLTHVNQQQNSIQQDYATAGLWLAHGDETLMTQWLVEALRHHWQKQGQNITRVELKSAKTWQEVLAELDSLSLFSPANAIIVTGNHKPDKDTQLALIDFANRVQQEQQSNPAEVQNHLLWIAPKQDKRALSAKWSQAFSQHGLIIDCNVYNESQRQQILQQHAQLFGLSLTTEAWQLLMSHTQNHLLNAYQSLWRLSYLFTAESSVNEQAQTVINQTVINIDAQQLQSAIVSEASYSVYDLSDAMLAGNPQQVVKIINGLQTTNESPIRVLWTISKDMRLIQQLHSGKAPQEIGIWSSKQGIYRSAMNRVNPRDTENWSELLFKGDCAVKGVIKQPVWELLLQSALAVAGVRLFSN